MQNLKERATRSYHLYRFAAAAGIAVAIAAVCVSPSFADYGNNGTSTMSSSSTGIDYSILADPDMDHFAIMRAKAYGLNDSQVAQCAKLAHLAWVPMREVISKVEDGRTIANLCLDYGVPVDRVMDSSDWQGRISDYMTAYSNTGLGEIRHGPPSVVSSYSTNGMGYGPAITPNGTTITPNGTAVTPNGTTITPNGTTVTPNGTTITPSGTTVAPDGTTTTPGGTTVTPNGTTTTPGGTTVAPDGTTVTPSGTVVAPNGTTTP